MSQFKEIRKTFNREVKNFSEVTLKISEHRIKITFDRVNPWIASEWENVS